MADTEVLMGESGNIWEYTGYTDGPEILGLTCELADGGIQYVYLGVS